MNILNYYTTGITSRGYKSFLENNIEEIENIIYVKGIFDNKQLTERVKIFLEKHNNKVEYIHNPYKENSLEAIICRPKSFAVIFEVNIEQPLKDYIGVEVLDSSKALIKDQYKKYKSYVTLLQDKRKECLETAYLFLNNALKIHDEWENIYITHMDFEKANKLSDELIIKLIGDKRQKKKAITYDRFLGAATPAGSKDFIDNLTADVAKRYFIKGRPGTGKSTILKKIAKKAAINGFDIEIYHCGFDPNSLDMLIIRELNICIFDSTAPHEYFPDRATDEIVDVYKEAVECGTDEKFLNSINEIAMRYKSNITIAISYLKNMSVLDEEIQRLVNACTDYELLEKINNDIIEKLNE